MHSEKTTWKTTCMRAGGLSFSEALSHVGGWYALNDLWSDCLHLMDCLGVAVRNEFSEEWVWKYMTKLRLPNDNQGQQAKPSQ